MSRPLLVRAEAPAKVNLRLEVLGLRDDGFHGVRTWMLAIDLCDRLEARASTTGRVTLALTGEQASPDIPSGPENLVVRAADSVLEEGRRRRILADHAGVDLVLDKRIPSRSGLGGGSSDAAAAWMATEVALGVVFGAAQRAAALARLGSDCAFFSSAGETGFALCEGRGERVTIGTGPGRSLSVALVVPGIDCGTARVYAALDERGNSGRTGPDPPSGWLERRAGEVRRFLGNGLEAAAVDAFPELRAWRELLDGLGLDHWQLSGSGSSFFGIHDGREEAEDACTAVSAAARNSSLALRLAWAGPPSGRGANIVEVR